ncbi:MAG TPA: DegT/DnrJ/EryC1/StrS aminotransferase family protein [Steroidobacteraceae bacterium]|nr:DegT/DnrJ/EryC1/StrS aminotransferase family protein [Steroidobacteraceae bacterium]
MTRPFLPFARPDIDETTIATVSDVLRSGWITTGKHAARFEEVLSELVGGRLVRALTSATAALEIALEIAGIGPGDEVIVPALSFVASANVVLRVGARPVFVDVDLESRNIDFDRLEAAISKRTKAIMPVHFAGLPVDLDRLYAFAQRHNLRVIEDAAHAIGSRWRGNAIGALGDLVCFSFHPNKTITSIEGGAVVVSTLEEATQVELHRFHGLKRDANGESEVYAAGGKSNLTDVAAAVGIGQLARLDEFVRRRQHLARRYLAALEDWRIGELPAPGDDGHSWHLFTVLLPFDRLGMSRAGFIQAMRALGIGIGIHYDAIPAFELYRKLGYRPDDYPRAARIGRETVSLPLFPAMTDADVDRVCDALRAVARR